MGGSAREIRKGNRLDEQSHPHSLILALSFLLQLYISAPSWGYFREYQASYIHGGHGMPNETTKTESKTIPKSKQKMVNFGYIF